MAVPSYSTDLIVITTAESGTWGEITGYTSGGTPAIETDYYIQGTGCYSQSTGGKTGLVVTMYFNYGSDLAASITTGKCVFFWQIVTAGNAMDTFANGGLRLGIGSSAADFKMWISGGNNFGRNPYGGWQNIAIDPRYNTSTPDYTIGSPGAVWQYFASQPNFLAAISKGSPHALDAIRYGRGEIKIEYGTSGDGYGTFAGIAAKNDANNATDGYNRWGLFQTEGTGYLWKGLLSFGNATNACQFVDSNRNITVDNTPRTYTSFNKININNASSIVTWTNINIIALSASQLSKGDFEVVNNANVNLNSCSFTDLNTFIFQSNSTIIDTTFRRCAQVTGGGASFDGCLFANSSAAVSLVLTNLNQVTDCDFVSDGGNHAINLGTISSTVSMNWNNYLTNYATSDGSGGNEAILVSVSSGQTLTINVGTGYSTPSVYNTGSGTVTVVSGQVTTSVTVKDLITGDNLEAARVLIWATDNTNKFYNASVSIVGSGTTATVTHTGHGLVTGDKVIISGVTNDDDYNGVFSITYISSSSYSYTADDTLTSPATGTPVAKWAIISGTTNSSGYIEDVRSFGSPQPITGWVRKTSASPYFQEGAVSGIISIANGFSSTIQLVRDQ